MEKLKPNQTFVLSKKRNGTKFQNAEAITALLISLA